MKKMRSLFVVVVAVAALTGCNKGNKGKGLPDDGQLHGVAPAPKWSMPKPPGMVYIPSGTFHMGPSDEDVNYSFTARNKQVSISGFWMDATEITNNEYRQYTNWVKDSIAAKLMGSIKKGKDGKDGHLSYKMDAILDGDGIVGLWRGMADGKHILNKSSKLYGKVVAAQPAAAK
jgi:formylglycine-generating enzyme required for sulfatase activity